LINPRIPEEASINMDALSKEVRESLKLQKVDETSASILYSIGFGPQLTIITFITRVKKIQEKEISGFEGLFVFFIKQVIN